MGVNIARPLSPLRDRTQLAVVYKRLINAIAEQLLAAILNG